MHPVANAAALVISRCPSGFSNDTWLPEPEELGQLWIVRQRQVNGKVDERRER